MRASVERTGVPWYVPHLGPRAGYVFRPEPIHNAAEGRGAADELLVRLIRIWLANRGVWEAIVGAGPVVPVPATEEDVDAYVDAWDSLLVRLTS
jgi:glutamate-1-semialdehyde 2,1-aminomutase